MGRRHGLSPPKASCSGHDGVPRGRVPGGAGSSKTAISVGIGLFITIVGLFDAGLLLMVVMMALNMSGATIGPVRQAPGVA
jgi:hypothetical protein